VQEAMCGFGQEKIDKNYKPQFPAQKDFKPTKEFPFEGTGEIECEAFGYFKNIDLIVFLEEHVTLMKKAFDKD